MPATTGLASVFVRDRFDAVVLTNRITELEHPLALAESIFQLAGILSKRINTLSEVLVQANEDVINVLYRGNHGFGPIIATMAATIIGALCITSANAASAKCGLLLRVGNLSSPGRRGK